MAGNLGKGLIQATSSAVQTVHTVAKTTVKTGMEGVLGPSDESLKEMEKQAEIEKLKKKKINNIVSSFGIKKKIKTGLETP